jgi:hypothetical protein
LSPLREMLAYAGAGALVVAAIVVVLIIFVVWVTP